MPRRRVSVLPAYSWDARVHNYVDIASGQFVARSEVLGLLDDVSESIGSTIGDLAAAAQRGDISARQFYEGARRTLKHGYNADVALGMGGWDRVTPAEWGRNGGHLRRQYEYLRNFADQIEKGELTEAQAVARGRLYADGAHKRYWETHQEGMAAAGYNEERWVTMGDAAVCLPAWTTVVTSLGSIPIQFVQSGMRALTRDGYREVTKIIRSTSSRLLRVKTTRGDVWATPEHPFWVSQQAWLECRYLNVGQFLESPNQEGIKILAVDLVFADAANTPTVSPKIPVFAGIPLGISMPISTIDFQGNSLFGQEKIYAISTKGGFLNEGNRQQSKSHPGFPFYRSFPLEAPITTEGTKLPIGVTRKRTKFRPASPTANEMRRSAAFFRTMPSGALSFPHEDFPAPLTGDIFGIGYPAFMATNGVSVGNAGIDQKDFLTDWAYLLDFGISGGVIASRRTEFLIPRDAGLWSIELLAALFATTDFAPFCGGMVTGVATKDMLSFASSWARKSLSTVFANVMKHGCSWLTRLNIVYHAWRGTAIPTYNLQIEGKYEFYANDILVHNCPICSGLEALGAQPIGSLPTPPDPHPGCRCRKEFRQVDGKWE